MALSSTVFHFEIDLADSDRGVYESLALRVARHPSESDEFLIARVLAYCLEYREGIEFSRGLSDADEPPVSVRDLTGTVRTWIDVGTPSADRLHRAAKSTADVVVYVHKDPTQWLSGLASARIHRADEVRILAVDRTFVARLVARLDRRVSCAMSVAEGEVFVSFADETVSGRVSPIRIG